MHTFIDTHSHLDFEEFQDNFDEILQKCQNAKVQKIIIPGVTKPDTPRIIDLVNKYEMLFGAVGIHPSEAKSWDDSCYNYFKEIAQNKKIVAVGEIGLDYYWDKTFNDIQQDVFRKQIELAKEIKKPIIIHDREAHFDTLQILKEMNAKEVGVVMHCFSGSVEFMKECIKEDFYIALGGVTTFKNAIKPKEVAQTVPLEKLLLETDAPYLTPMPHRGKTNYPFYIPLIAQEIATLKNIDIKEIALATTQNAQKLFAI